MPTSNQIHQKLRLLLLVFVLAVTSFIALPTNQAKLDWELHRELDPSLSLENFPLPQGLVRFYSFADLEFRDIKEKHRPQWSAPGGSFYRHQEGFGIRLAPDGGGGLIDSLGLDAGRSLDAFTFSGTFKLHELQGLDFANDYHIFGFVSPQSRANHFQLIFKPLQQNVALVFGEEIAETPANSIKPDIPINLLVRVDKAEQLVEFFLNGKRISRHRTDKPLPSLQEKMLVMGEHASSVVPKAPSVSGIVQNIGVWERRLSDDEIKRVAAFSKKTPHNRAHWVLLALTALSLILLIWFRKTLVKTFEPLWRLIRRGVTFAQAAVKAGLLKKIQQWNPSTIQHLKKTAISAGYILTSLLFLYVYLPENECCSVRGEHWWIIHFLVKDIPWSEKLWELSNFGSIPGQRGTILAYYLHIIPFLIFGTKLSGYYYFSYLFHFLSAGMLVKVLAELGVERLFRYLAFSMFMLSFILYETLTWTFFVYVEVHTLLTLVSLWGLIRYEHRPQPLWLLLHHVPLILGYFFYEISLVFYPLFLLIELTRRNYKRAFLYVIDMGVIYLILFLVLGGMPNQGDAAKVFHPMGLLFQSVLFVYHLVINMIGLGPSTVLELRIFHYLHEIGAPLWKGMNLLYLIAAILFLPIMLYSAFARIIKNDRNLRILVFPILAFMGYVGAMIYARVYADELYSFNSYFQGQSRYYYLPMAFALIILFSSKLPKKRELKVALIGAVALFCWGNVSNIIEFQNRKTIYCHESKLTTDFTDSNPDDVEDITDPEQYFQTYLSYWHREAFPLENWRLTQHYIYNTSTAGYEK